MKIIKTFVVKCDVCNEIIEVHDDMDCVNHDDRQMGFEYEYERIVEEVCPNCGNELNIIISAWEYTGRALNYKQTKVIVAEIIEEPKFSLD